MTDFEKKYYESNTFWDGEMLQDENNQLRIKLTAELIPGNVKSLVDIGCGNGVFLNYLAKNKTYLDLLGVDRSETALSYVKTEKKVADITKLPFDDNSFDCVTCLEVIEHLPANVYEIALKELTRISKKYVIISVPYNEKIEDSYTKCPSCLSIFNYELHLRSYLRNDMNNLLDNYSFKVSSIQTFGNVIKYWGHNLFVKIFYPKQLLKWNSPICPLCGFSEDKKNELFRSKPLLKRSIVSYFTSLPKLVWPKTKRHYWIMALYQKSD